MRIFYIKTSTYSSFKKNTNLILPSNVVIKKIDHINSGLIFILIPEASLKQLEKNADYKTQTFGV